MGMFILLQLFAMINDYADTLQLFKKMSRAKDTELRQLQGEHLDLDC